MHPSGTRNEKGLFEVPPVAWPDMVLLFFLCPLFSPRLFYLFQKDASSFFDVFRLSRAVNPHYASGEFVCFHTHHTFRIVDTFSLFSINCRRPISGRKRGGRVDQTFDYACSF